MGQPIDTATVAIVPDFSGFAAAANRDTDRALRSVAQEAERAFAQVERSATEAGREVAIELRRGGSLAEGALREVGTQARIMAGQVEVASAGAGVAVGSRIAAGAAVAKAALVGVGIAAVAGLAAVAGFGLRAAAQLEQTQIGFESLLGSAEAAKDFLGELQQFAAVTPFEFQGIADASRRILAFGTSVGITQEQVIPTITTIGNLVSVLGGTQESTDAVVRAFGQIASKGRLMGGEILQIAEALPGFNANQALAAHLGVTVAEALELQERGEIDAKTAIDALLAGMAQFPGAAGAMEKQALTLLGVFSTFKDTLSIALTTAFQPVIPAIKDSLAEVTPVLEAALNELAPALGGFVATLLPLLGELVAGLTPILVPIIDAFSEIAAIVTPLLRPLGAAIGKVVEAIAPLLPIIAEIAAQILVDLAPVLVEMAPIITDLLPPLLELLQALVPIVPEVAQLVIAITPLLRVLAILAAGLLTLATRFALTPILEAAITIINDVTEIFGRLIDFVSNIDWSLTWRNIVAAFVIAGAAIAKFFTQDLPGFFSAGWTKVKEFFASLGPTIIGFGADLLQKFVNLGANIIAGIVQGIRNGAGSIGTALRNAATSAIGGLGRFLGIGSPSKLMADEIGRWLPAGIGMGVEQGSPGLLTTIAGLVGDIAAITGRGSPSSSLTVDVGGVVVNGSATVSDAATIGATVGRSVASAARRVQIAQAVRMAA